MQNASACRPDQLRSLRDRRFADEAQRIVLLHGCALNRPATLKRLGTVLRGYEGLPDSLPAAVVFIGPFFEREPLQPAATAAEMRHGFATLAAIISVFPRLQVRTSPTQVLGCRCALPPTTEEVGARKVPSHR